MDLVAYNTNQGYGQYPAGGSSGGGPTTTTPLPSGPAYSRPDYLVTRETGPTPVAWNNVPEYLIPSSSRYWQDVRGIKQSSNLEYGQFYSKSQTDFMSKANNYTSYAIQNFNSRFATPQQNFTLENANKVYTTGNGAMPDYYADAVARRAMGTQSTKWDLRTPVMAGSAAAIANPGAPRYDPPVPGARSFLGPQGSFAPLKADMGGNVYTLSRAEKAASYSQNFPELYATYVEGGLTDQQLFSRALTDSVKFDTDRLGFGGTPAGTPISFTQSFGGGSQEGGSIWNTSNYGGLFNFKSINTNWNTSGKSIAGGIYSGSAGFKSMVFR